MFITSFAFSQQSEQQLAYQYYINGNYEKAVTIYKELTEKQFSIAYYHPYFLSLLAESEFSEAEKLAKIASKKYPSSLSYKLETAIAQQKGGKAKKAERGFKKITEQITGQRSQAINLANTFRRHQLFQKALSVYVLAEQRNIKSNFAMQKAELYAQLGKSDLMVEEYLNELAINPKQKRNVISNIQRFLDNNGIKNESNYQLVKKALLPHVRKEKGRSDFTEMLIWLFMQNHQFNMALRQAKALDKRVDGDGAKVYDLAETFLDNKDYNLAVEGYEYVIAKGSRNDLFINANINKLFAMTKSLSSKEEDTSILDKDYEKVIAALGVDKNTVLLLSNYAHFKAFVLHDLKAADLLLSKAMNIPQISNIDLAECKLEYADIQLLLGNIWESLLYYSQVEKDFKENPIGHEAKLRRARIAYYQGDFNWAQAQLDVLKASTTKLIANDAMDLSLLITDNLNLDTTELAMRAFSAADLLSYQQRYDEAIVKYDFVLTVFKGHTLSDEIYMRKAEIYFKQNKFELALEMYAKINSEFSDDILADDALYHQARIYDLQLNDSEKAMQFYEKIVLDHSSSIFTAHARKRFRALRGDNLNEEE